MIGGKDPPLDGAGFAFSAKAMTRITVGFNDCSTFEPWKYSRFLNLYCSLIVNGSISFLFS
jgi:hypothetical protein